MGVGADTQTGRLDAKVRVTLEVQAQMLHDAPAHVVRGRVGERAP